VVNLCVCGRSIAGIAGTNPAEGIDVLLFRLFCVVKVTVLLGVCVYNLCGLQTSTLRRCRAKLSCSATEFGVTWCSNCIRYWAANTNNNTVFIMCVTSQATDPGHRSTTTVWWNTTVHVSKSAPSRQVATGKLYLMRVI
jgi:hypothetical protein